MNDAGDWALRIATLGTDMSGQVGGRLTLGEFMEVMEVALRDTGWQAFEVRATLKGVRPYARVGESRVRELGDAIFVDTSLLLNDIFAVRRPRHLSPAEMGARLTSATKRSRISFNDILVDDIEGLTFHPLKNRAARPRLGDVLAIPSRTGGFHLAVVVARNRFGTALGLLRGRIDAPFLPREPLFATSRVPVYSDVRLVADGSWKIVGNVDTLVSQFPAQPERYHAPDLPVPGFELGEFGAAEKATGEMRLIGANEARDIGLLDRTYRQSYLGEDLEKLLDEVADRW